MATLRKPYVSLFGREPDQELDDVLFFHVPRSKETNAMALNGLMCTIRGKPKPKAVAQAIEQVRVGAKLGAVVPGTLPGFPRMTHIVFRKCGYDLGKATVLQLCPLLPDEAEFLRSRPADDPEVAHLLGGTDLANPKRGPFVAPRAKQKGPATPLQRAWRQLDELYRLKAPSLRRYLLDSPGAPRAAIDQFEQRLGSKLPADVRAHFATHNGSVQIFEYEGLSMERSLNRWRGLRGIKAFHRWWIPLFQDGGGNLLCVDAPSGIIMQWEMQGHDCFPRARSLTALLSGYRKGIASGELVYDSHSHVFAQC